MSGGVHRHHRISTAHFALDTIEQPADPSFTVDGLNTLVVTCTSTSIIERSYGSISQRHGPGGLCLTVVVHDHKRLGRGLDPAALAEQLRRRHRPGIPRPGGRPSRRRTG
ncbi:hypothetical protein [Planobispora takensis]|uniref:Uncharacterized protein n=1 Tax=Planobispora takensis TaxID=1367882 RepID=A0A8J3T536_9ACTN|nr:hypothetical protein [Planobispora takensis]GII05331.1 hypothetical protein Pta02_73390 [Planobispora takensis]